MCDYHKALLIATETTWKSLYTSIDIPSEKSRCDKFLNSASISSWSCFRPTPPIINICIHTKPKRFCLLCCLIFEEGPIYFLCASRFNFSISARHISLFSHRGGNSKTCMNEFRISKSMPAKSLPLFLCFLLRLGRNWFSFRYGLMPRSVWLCAPLPFWLNELIFKALSHSYSSTPRRDTHLYGADSPPLSHSLSFSTYLHFFGIFEFIYVNSWFGFFLQHKKRFWASISFRFYLCGFSFNLETQTAVISPI